MINFRYFCAKLCYTDSNPTSRASLRPSVSRGLFTTCRTHYHYWQPSRFNTKSALAKSGPTRLQRARCLVCWWSVLSRVRLVFWQLLRAILQVAICTRGLFRRFTICCDPTTFSVVRRPKYRLSIVELKLWSRVPNIAKNSTQLSFYAPSTNIFFLKTYHI